MSFRSVASACFVVAVLSIHACAPTKRERPHEELPPAGFVDDADRVELLRAIDHSLEGLRRTPPERLYPLGNQTVRAADLLRTLELFRATVAAVRTVEDWNRLVPERFRVVRVHDDPYVFTGYAVPRLSASRERRGPFRFPLYRLPDDLVDIDLGLFCEACAGRVASGRLQGRDVVPYYSREEIEAGALAGRDLAIAWLSDPVDAFFLHVQGAALLRFDDGSFMHLTYAGSNGRPFGNIGKFLVETGKLDRDRVSVEAIRSYLRAHPEEQPEVFRANPRYLFFRPVPLGPIGAMGVPLTPGRSLATDPLSVPFGAVAYIRTVRPGGSEGETPLQRFVLVQDTTPAIVGPDRADVYWGVGETAQALASAMRARGELHVLLAK